MPIVSLGTTPAERMRGCTFAEAFFSDTTLAENGGSATGSPVISNGATFDGTTDYVSYSVAGGEFDSPFLTFTLRFTPDFDYDSDDDYTLFQAIDDAGTNFLIKKLSNTDDNTLRVIVAGRTMDVTEGEYSSYWLENQVNEIAVVSSELVATSTLVYLNGTQVASFDTAHVEYDVTTVLLGATSGGSDFFSGVIHNFKFFQSALTAGEILDSYDGTTYNYKQSMTLDFPCDNYYYNPTEHLVKDATNNGNDATLGDGSTAGLMPTKILGKPGFAFDGSDDYLTGISNPTGDYTVTVMKRVSGVVSITHENDLTTWATLFTSGGFDGDLLSLRLHSSLLTETQKKDEIFDLNQRYNTIEKGTGVLNDLISEGACVMYHDYRSGSFRDWSENGNSAIPGIVTWGTDTLNVPLVSSDIRVAEDSSLRLTTGSLVVYGDFTNVSASGRVMTQYDGVGDWRFLWTWNSSTNQFTFSGEIDESGVDPVINGSMQNREYLAVNFTEGESPQGFHDGVSIGDYSEAWGPGPDNADTYIGSSAEGGGSLVGALFKAALVFNRPLSEAEHNALYADLNAKVWATTSSTNVAFNLCAQQDTQDNSLVLGVDMHPFMQGLDDRSSYNHTIDINDCTARLDRMGPGFDWREEANQYLLANRSSALEIDGNGTYEMWCRTNTYTVSAPRIYEFGGLKGFRFFVIGATYRFAGYDSSLSVTFPENIEYNKWEHIVVVTTKGTYSLYVNGELQETDSFEFATPEYQFYYPGVSIGADTNGGRPYVGRISAFNIYNESKDADWVAEQYAKGLGAYWQTDYKINETITNVTTGPITNSGFEVESGSVKVINEDIDSVPHKVLEANSASVVSISRSLMQEDSTENAYGTWEFMINKATSSNPKIHFINSASDGTGDGYYIDIKDDEQILLYSTFGPYRLATDDDAMSSGAWTKFRVSRTIYGVFRLWVDDVLVSTIDGANPTDPDNSYEVSDYIVFELDTGDKISLGNNVDDTSSIKKYLVTKKA